MKFKQSGLARLYNKVQSHDCGCITAYCSKEYDDNRVVLKVYTKKENQDRNRQLLALLLRKGHGVTSVEGGYIENFGTKEAEFVGEHTFFVEDMEDSGNLKQDLQELGAKFNQDSILFIPQGGVNATLVGTNNAWPGLGSEEPVGSFTGGKDGELFSKKGNRPFIFGESVEEHIPPEGAMGRWALKSTVGWLENKLKKEGIMNIKLTKDHFIEGQIIEAGTTVQVGMKESYDLSLSKALGGTLIYIDDSAERLSFQGVMEHLIDFNSNLWLGTADYIPRIIVADREQEALEILEVDARGDDYDNEVQLDSLLSIDTSIADRSIITRVYDRGEGREVVDFGRWTNEREDDLSIKDLTRFIQNRREETQYMDGYYSWGKKDFASQYMENTGQIFLKWIPNDSNNVDSPYFVSISWGSNSDILSDAEIEFYGDIWMGNISFNY